MLGWDISRDIVASIEGRGRVVADFELLILAHVLQAPLGSLFSSKITWDSLGYPVLDTSQPEGIKTALGLNFAADQAGNSDRE